MILIDKRRGSADLYLPLVACDLECQLTTMPFGDVAFVGHGPSGPLAIGIERKRISTSDLTQSLMSGRLGGYQNPGCQAHYDRTWLIVEGTWRTSRQTGLVERWHGGRYVPVQPTISGKALNGWLLTLELRGGLKVAHTRDADDTAEYINALYRWWTEKEWHEHRSHLALYHPPDGAIFHEADLVQVYASRLPGIGEEKAAVVAEHFATPLEMCCAGVQTWQQIPGIGPLIASRAVERLQRPKDPTGRTRIDSARSSSPTATCSTPISGTRSKKRSRS